MSIIIIINNEMKKTNKSAVFYDSPVVEIVEIEAASVLCASSDKLDDLKKQTFDFGWEY